MVENEQVAVRNTRIVNLFYWVLAVPALIIGLIVAGGDGGVSVLGTLWVIGALGAIYTYFTFVPKMGASIGCNALPMLGGALIGGPIAWGIFLSTIKFCEACGDLTHSDNVYCPHCGYKRK